MQPIKLSGFLAKSEDTYGTDAVPVAGTDGVRPSKPLRGGTITPRHEFVNAREDAISGTLVPVSKAKPAGRVCDVEFETYLGGLGAAYAAASVPQWVPLALAAGLSVVVDDTAGAETVTLAMVNSDFGAATLYAFDEDKVFKIRGYRGNMKLNVTSGGLITAQFSGMGLLAAPEDLDLPNITSYSAVRPPTVRAAGLSIVGNDTWTPRWESFEFDLGNVVNLIPDGSAADAVDSFQIVGRNPQVTLKAQSVPLSTYDPFTENRNAVQNTIDVTLGEDKYNRLDIDIDEAYLENDPGLGDIASLTAWDLIYKVHQLQMVLD